MIRPVYIIGYVLWIAIAAQWTIELDLPNVTIPVSGQTLAILTGAVFLIPKESAIAILLYWIIGIIGLPVFSDGSSGWESFSGNSLGYFIGFFVAAVMASYLSMKGWSDTVLKLFAIQVLGTLIILTMGTGFLCMKFGLVKGIEYGFTPFISGGLVKILLGVFLVWLIHNFNIFPRTHNCVK